MLKLLKKTLCTDTEEVLKGKTQMTSTLLVTVKTELIMDGTTGNELRSLNISLKNKLKMRKNGTVPLARRRRRSLKNQRRTKVSSSWSS